MSSKKKTPATPADIARTRAMSGPELAKQFAITSHSVTRLLADVQADVQSRLDDLEAVERVIEQRKEELSAVNEAAAVLEAAEAFKAEQEEIRKAWEREQEEYEYQRGLRTKTDIDAFEAMKRERAAQEADTLRYREREYTERLRQLQENEARYKAATDKLATFDADVAKAAAAQTAAAVNAVKKDADHAAAMARVVADARINELKSLGEGLAARLQDAEKEIESLRVQLAGAYAAATGIAKGAIDGAAQAKASADALALGLNAGQTKPAR